MIKFNLFCPEFQVCKFTSKLCYLQKLFCTINKNPFNSCCQNGGDFMNTKELLGKRLKELIKHSGYSQEKLAEMVNIEPSALSNIITGRNYPLFQNLEKIVNVLGITYKDVFNFEHHETPENLKIMIDKILNENPDKMQEFYKIAKALTE